MVRRVIYWLQEIATVLQCYSSIAKHFCKDIMRKPENCRNG